MHSPLYLPRLPLLIILTIFFALACKDREQPESVQPPTEKVVLPATVMNDSIWKADSIKLIELWGQYWQADQYFPDTAIAICKEMIRIGSRAMDFKFDSVLYEKYAKAHGGIGFNLNVKGELNESLEATLHSYKLISDKFGENHIRNTELCVGVSDNYSKRGDFDQAINWQKKALSIIHNLYPAGNHHYFGNILRNLGYYYNQKGDPATALTYYKIAVKRGREVKEEKHNLPSCLIKMADCYRLLSNHGLAIESLHEAEAIILTRFLPTYLNGNAKQKSRNYKNLIDCYYTSGLVYLDMGSLNKAEEKFRKAQAISMENGLESKWSAILLFELGNVSSKRSAWSEALSQYNAAHAASKSYGMASIVFTEKVLNAITHVYTQKGEYRKALVNCQATLSTLSPAFNKDDFTHNPPVEKLGSSLFLLETLYTKANIFQSYFHSTCKESYLHAALDTYELLLDYLDKMRLGFKWQGSKQTLSALSLPMIEQAINNALEMYALYEEDRYLDKAFSYVEQSKAILLLENINARQVDLQTNPGVDLLRYEEKINQDIALYERMIIEAGDRAMTPDSTKLYYWYQSLVDAKVTLDSIKAELEKKHPEYYRLKYTPKKVSVAQLKRSLASRELLIEYFLSGSTLTTIVMSRDQIDVYRQKLDSSFFTTADRLRNFSSHPSTGSSWVTDFNQFISDSRYLYKVLLAPFLNTPADKNSHRTSLVIIPDGLINFVPFNLLLTEAPAPASMAFYDYRSLPYLIRDFDIRYEYSATLLMQNSLNDRNGFLKKILPHTPAYRGFAPAYGDGLIIASRGVADSIKLEEYYPGFLRGELGALQYNKPEVIAAARTTGGKPFLGLNATERIFKQEAGQADILHLAMHALTNDKDPLFSQLAFEFDENDSIEDGRLHAYELYDMNLKAELTVLSACNTGIGKLQRGEGVMSLSRAFKYAGCTNIVMSMWTANDLSTQQIINGFFDNLKERMGKSTALCEAQRNFLESTPGQYATHPYYWSTLVLIGDGSPVWDSATSKVMLPVAVLILTGICLFMWRYRRRDSRQPI